MSNPECAQVIPRLPDYLDGDASAARCAEIEHHLETCTDCRVLLAALRQTARHDHAEPMPAAVPDRLYRAPGPNSSLRF